MDFESQFKSNTPDEKLREQILHQIKLQSESWPDMVALWSGMVRQLTDDGWEEMAARALVLSNVTMHNYSIIANIPGAFDDND